MLSVLKTESIGSLFLKSRIYEGDGYEKNNNFYFFVSINNFIM